MSTLAVEMEFLDTTFIALLGSRAKKIYL